jgi:hypothetical protein
MRPPTHDTMARQHSGEPTPVPVVAGSGTADQESRAQQKPMTKLPNWSIGQFRICGLAGASCIAPDRLWASVAI